MSGNPIQSWILDSTLSIPNSGYWIPDSLSAEIVFWIPVVSGFWISWAGLRILKPRIPDWGFHKQMFPVIADSTSKNFPESGFLKQQFPGFWIPQAKISRILNSKSKDFPDSGFDKPKFIVFWIPQEKISRILDSRLPYMGRHKDITGIFVCLFVLSKRDRQPIWEGSIPGRGFPEVISPSQVRPYGQ